MDEIMRTRLLSLLDMEKDEDLHREKTKVRALHDAAVKGSVASLHLLLRQDPLILDRTPSLCDTPLHVAALLGHLDFARELLSRKPELSGSLNSNGSTPLHLASAKGYAEVVRELVISDPDASFLLDRDGRSPIHLAAIKGRVAVLDELTRVKPEAVRVLTSSGETCLHLCVNHNRLEALKLLVDQSVKKDEFVNWKDGDGNTVLHLAVAKKQIEIIRFLLASTSVDSNTRNTNGLTALDVLLRTPRDLRDMEIKDCLRQGRSPITKRPSSVTNNPKEKEMISGSEQTHRPKKHKDTDWLGRKRSALMVVASLIATVAFQAAVSPPSGVWQNDSTVDSEGKLVNTEAGKSVMAYNIPLAYGQFMIFDTIAFLASLSIILLQISGLPLKRRRWMWVQMVTMWVAITAQTITYFIAWIHMTPDEVKGTLYQVTKISGLGWASMMGVVFIGNAVRIVKWLLRKYGYVKKEEKESLINGGEDDENDDL